MWRSSSRLLDRAHDRPSRKLDLEAVMGKAGGAMQNDVSRLAKRLSAGLLARENFFAIKDAPGLMGDTTQRYARLLYYACLNPP